MAPSHVQVGVNRRPQILPDPGPLGAQKLRHRGNLDDAPGVPIKPVLVPTPDLRDPIDGTVACILGPEMISHLSDASMRHG